MKLTESQLEDIESGTWMYDGEYYHDEEKMLAALLLDEICFLNSGSPWFDKKEKTTVVCVNAPDVFAWAAADAESILPAEIPDLYNLWRAHGEHGAVLWLCMKRNMQPQAAIKKDLIRAGLWEDKYESLPENSYEIAIREIKEAHIAVGTGIKEMFLAS